MNTSPNINNLCQFSLIDKKLKNGESVIIPNGSLLYYYRLYDLLKQPSYIHYPKRDKIVDMTITREERKLEYIYLVDIDHFKFRFPLNEKELNFFLLHVFDRLQNDKQIEYFKK